jgi:hypothetical protein
MPVTNDLKLTGLSSRASVHATVNKNVGTTKTTAVMTVGKVSECGPAAAAM